MLIGRDCLLRKQLNINPNVNFQGVEIWENHLWNLANLTDTMPRVLPSTQDPGWGPSAEFFTPEHTLRASRMHRRPRLEPLGWGAAHRLPGTSSGKSFLFLSRARHILADNKFKDNISPLIQMTQGQKHEKYFTGDASRFSEAIWGNISSATQQSLARSPLQFPL